MEAYVAQPAFEEPAPPLTALRWRTSQVIGLVAWAAGLNVGQSLALHALDVSALPGEWQYYIRAAVVVAFYAAIIAPVLVSARRQGVRLADAVGLRPVPLGAVVGLSVFAVFAARILAVLWAVAAVALHLKLPGGNVDITRVFGSSPFGIAFTVIVAIVVGPFVEEVVFRGVAFAQLERVQGTLGAIAGSSVLFGLLHVNPLELVPLVLAGALFAWVFKASGSLWTAIVAHAGFNLIAIVALYALKVVGA